MQCYKLLARSLTLPPHLAQSLQTARLPKLAWILCNIGRSITGSYIWLICTAYIRHVAKPWTCCACSWREQYNHQAGSICAFIPINPHNSRRQHHTTLQWWFCRKSTCWWFLLWGTGGHIQSVSCSQCTLASAWYLQNVKCHAMPDLSHRSNDM